METKRRPQIHVLLVFFLHEYAKPSDNSCMHELSRNGKSLSTTAAIALFAYAQPFWHATDQLLETAVLLAFLLLPVALQQLGSPLLELADRDHPARGVVRLLTFGEIASQPCPYSFDGIEVPRVWWESLELQAVCPVDIRLAQKPFIVLPHVRLHLVLLLIGVRCSLHGWEVLHPVFLK